MIRMIAIAATLGVATLSGPAHADFLTLPSSGRDAVVGEIRTVPAAQEDTLVDIARRFDIGQDEMTAANPKLSRWVPGENAHVVVPSLFILPKAPREGIVVNVGELRLYYFPDPISGGPRRIETHPISIGRMDWSTPLGKTSVVAKEKDPPWRPTASIRAEHAADGDPLPEVIPGGTPENPLGHYALRLGVTGYLIHGTDEQKSLGIGMRVTHGCIRMYPEDIEKLFSQVDVKTPVYLVHQPVKVGWRDSALYLEIHRELDENDQALPLPSLDDVMRAVGEEAAGDADVDQSAVERALAQHSGIPAVIGRTRSELPPARLN